VKPEARTRIISLAIGLFLLGGLALLVFFAPLLAAILFVIGVAITAVFAGRGFWGGAKIFVKEMLFGW
jgi:hypothetical protein